MSVKFVYLRFISIWCFFTVITVYVTRRATRQPIEPNTPRSFWWNLYFFLLILIFFDSIIFRLVYKWFLLVYKVSYGLAIGGYFLIMMTFLGINNLLLISPQVNLSIDWIVFPDFVFFVLDIVRLRYFDYVLWNLLRSTWSRYGRILYRPNGVKNWRK